MRLSLGHMYFQDPPRQTRAAVSRSDPKLLVCKKSAQGDIAGALKPAPQFGNFTLAALIWLMGKGSGLLHREDQWKT